MDLSDPFSADCARWWSRRVRALYKRWREVKRIPTRKPRSGKLDRRRQHQRQSVDEMIEDAGEDFEIAEGQLAEALGEKPVAAGSDHA